MNPELERLVQAIDRVRSCPSTKSEELARLKAIYEGCLLEVLERHPQVSRESLISLVEHAYTRWLRAQDKPSAMPPQA